MLDNIRAGALPCGVPRRLRAESTFRVGKGKKYAQRLQRLWTDDVTIQLLLRVLYLSMAGRLDEVPDR